MKQSPNRSFALINRTALQHNFHTVKALLHPGCKVLSVVKSDGYGHGDVEVAKTLDQSDYFGVACVDEAIRLREHGIQTPILILGYTPAQDIPLLARYTLTQCAVDRDYLLLLQKTIGPNQKLSVHVKIDTGMSRLGFYAHDNESAQRTAEEIARTISETPSLIYEGIFTHFTSSEEPHLSYTKEQFDCFLQVIESLKMKNVTFPLRHCCNSGATLLFPEFQLDMVRPGIVLYGYSPDPKQPFPLQPAMEWKTCISQIHHIEPGDAISYNRTFQADAPMDVATICVGYGDGLNRRYSKGGTVLVNGQKARILGKICMDQCVIDVTGIPAKQGDAVTLIGTDGEETITADSMAEILETISYEVLCNVGKRVPRIYTEK